MWTRERQEGFNEGWEKAGGNVAVVTPKGRECMGKDWGGSHTAPDGVFLD
jgi:hypothetical protein